MRAALYHRYGGPEVVSIAEIPTPVPKDGEVLVRYTAAQSTAQIPAFEALNILYPVFSQACYARNDLSWEQNLQERWWAWDEGLPYSGGAIGSSDCTSDRRLRSVSV